MLCRYNIPSHDAIAADLDTSVESDAVEDECSAELRRLKKERRAIGAQVTRAMHDLSALAQNSGFVVPSLSSSNFSTMIQQQDVVQIYFFTKISAHPAVLCHSFLLYLLL